METKVCNVCQVGKGLGEFYSSMSKTKKYYDSTCKSCRADQRNANREDYLAKRKSRYYENKDVIKVQNKKSREKNRDKILSRSREYKKNNKDKIIQSSREYNAKTKDVRAIKGREKRISDLDNFNRRARERRANRTPEQKQREIEYARNYRQINKVRIQGYQKRVAERTRVWKREWHQKKYRSDIQYKLLHNLRSRMKNAINGKAKDSTTLKLLGCTLLFFQNHIEKQFTEGMSWSEVLNGSIHIDHIKPCAKFDLTKLEEQKKCFHYTNLQPLWEVDNLRKGSFYQEEKITA